MDPGGAFDYDGDGRVELINVQAARLATAQVRSTSMQSANRGSYIVSPGLLTPGRQAAMLCGSCHSRPLGIGGGEKGLPLSEANEMPPPGIRRADFAVNHTTRVSGDPDEDFLRVPTMHLGTISSTPTTFARRTIRNRVPARDLHRTVIALMPTTADIAATDTSGNPQRALHDLPQPGDRAGALSVDRSRRVRDGRFNNHDEPGALPLH